MSADKPGSARDTPPPDRPQRPDHADTGTREAAAAGASRPAETRTRTEYLRDRHAAYEQARAARTAREREAEQTSGHDTTRHQPADGANSQHLTASRARSDLPEARPHGRADAARQTASDTEKTVPTQPGRDTGGQDAAHKNGGHPALPPDRPGRAPAENPEAPEPNGAPLAAGKQPRAGDHRPRDRNAITHFHGEFKGQATDLYTDGLRWATADAARNTSARDTKESGHERADESHGHGAGREPVTDFPSSREQGRNIVGDKPDRSPGDTSDLPPSGERLLEADDDTTGSRLERFGKKVAREVGDVTDGAKSQAETVRDLLQRPSPAGHPEAPVRSGPVSGSDAPHQAAPDPGAIAELGVVAGVIGFRVAQWVHHKVDARKGR